MKQASTLMTNKRIIVIGCPGSGKTTLSKALSSILDLPVFHLDSYFWLPGWRRRSQEERLRKLSEIVAGDSWILDGNYGDTLDFELQQTEEVIFLDFARPVCFWRVFKRRFWPPGKRLPDVAPGCPDKIDLNFLCAIWKFPSVDKIEIEARLKLHSDGIRVVRLRNPAEVADFTHKLLARADSETCPSPGMCSRLTGANQGSPTKDDFPSTLLSSMNNPTIATSYDITSFVCNRPMQRW